MSTAARAFATFTCLVFLLVAPEALAKRKAKKPKAPPRNFIELTQITVAESVIADLALIQEIVETKARAAFAAHPQVVVDRTGAPDPDTDKKGWARWLKKQKLKNAYKVNLEIIDAGEEVEPDPRSTNGQRLTVRLGLRLFGETIPARVMGFTGEGSSRIKLEIGKKVRDADRRYAWEGAAEQAITQAIAAGLEKLATQ